MREYSFTPRDSGQSKAATPDAPAPTLQDALNAALIEIFDSGEGMPDEVITCGANAAEIGTAEVLFVVGHEVRVTAVPLAKLGHSGAVLNRGGKAVATVMPDAKADPQLNAAGLIAAHVSAMDVGQTNAIVSGSL